MFANIRGRHLEIFHQNLICTRFPSKFYWTSVTAMNLSVTDCTHSSKQEGDNQLPQRKAASQSLPHSQLPILSPEERMATGAAWVSILGTWESCPFWDNRVSILWVLNSRKPQIKIKACMEKKKKKKETKPGRRPSSGSTLSPCEKTGATPEVDSRTPNSEPNGTPELCADPEPDLEPTSNLEHNLDP